ncbi:MAG: type II CRISPR RNA-guided endonuclease Cas9, partial [Phycisphaerae bacterium]|nr:type II CRISPR RNA-guided endonuclease Cas9 [Phycisphaerae bacterium]
MGDIKRFWLGLDLGTNSVGWSLICLDAQGNPCGVEALGVRVFEAGVEGDITQGKDASRAAERREKRAARRMLARRACRTRRVFHLLQQAGLLPAEPAETSDQRDQIIKALDAELRMEWVRAEDHVGQHLMPYRLRAQAVKGPMVAHALGRALYHLAQRRGFKSNRKTDRKDKESGVVKEGINKLSQDMEAAGCQYLGEYFATLNPDETRIRQRWTARAMYEKEFDRIMEVQKAAMSDVLTDKCIMQLKKAIFRQRPLKPQSHLIGECELEPGKKRAPMALPIAQRFRLLAAVNNLAVFESDGTCRALTPEEHKQLIEALEQKGDLKFDAVRKLLGFTKARGENQGHMFNLERGGEKRLCGNRTVAELRKVFGERWNAMDDMTQERIVYEVLSIQKDETLVKRAATWELDKAQIELLRQVYLEDSYAAFSCKALHRLVEQMADGTPLATAKKKLYGQTKEAEAQDQLPPVNQTIKSLRNPAVMRSLSELRKVVNGVIRQYGKPEMIRVELARDLKRGRQEREAIWKKNRDRETERKQAKEEIIKVSNGYTPSREDIEKYLLAKECNWLCPYTGRPISSPDALFDGQSEFDVEHIIPFSLSLDNSFANKTLCWADFNRHHKKNRSPMEAFDPESQEWDDVINRVRGFQGDARFIKLKRFQMTPEQVQEFYSDFTARHLADTRYASKLAREYLGVLYGGDVDAAGKQRVQVSSGSVTAFLRNEWELNGLLHAGTIKSRDDHRHHAVDATVIALTTPLVVAALSKAASRGGEIGRRFVPMLSPWAEMKNDLRDILSRVLVSHRMDHRIAGPLHAETNYSRAIMAMSPDGKKEHRHRRKSLDALSSNEIENIVDKHVREAVVAMLDGGDPKRVFVGITSPRRAGLPVSSGKVPTLKTRDGRQIPIRKVRVRVEENPFPVGTGSRTRHVTSGKDTVHHVELIEEQTKRGTRWIIEAVSRLEAHQRVARKEPVICQERQEGQSFVMAIHKGDCIEMEGEDGKREVYVVKSFQLPTIFAKLNPRWISVSLVMPRHKTMFPGGGS